MRQRKKYIHKLKKSPYQNSDRGFLYLFYKFVLQFVGGLLLVYDDLEMSSGISKLL